MTVRPAWRAFSDLAAHILASPLPAYGTRLVAIDGPAGAGKSTLAGRLARALGGAQTVHTDDFVSSWSDATEYWPRMYEQVLAPLLASRSGRYQRYDWDAGELAEWQDVPVAPVVLLEGVGCARREIAAQLTLAVWVTAPAKLRLSRGLARGDIGSTPDNWRLWIADEARHFADDATQSRAHVVIDGAPTLAMNPEVEFVELER